VANEKITDSVDLKTKFEGLCDFEGTIKDVKIEGPAKITGLDGRVLNATFKDGKLEGQSTYILPDGREYTH
jgi:hypothetical protein